MFKIYTRDGCTFCDAAKLMLSWGKYEFQEIKIGPDISREQVIEKFPDRKTLPIILKEDTLIGGYQELTDYLSNK
jgi:glutaredoxin